MKKNFTFCLFLFLFFFISTFSQNSIISKVDIEAHTIQNPRIDYNIWLNSEINVVKTVAYLKTVEFAYFSIKRNAVIKSIQIKRGINDKAIKFSVVPVSDLNLSDIILEDYPTAITSSKELKIYLSSGDSAVISSEELQSATITDKDLIEKLRTDLQEVNSIFKRDDINLSKEVNNSDSSSSEYIFDFDLQKPLLPDLLGFPLFYDLKGTVSTNENNPLNTISFYLRYAFQDNLYIEAGRVGPQKFNRNMIRAKFSYETLIPNFLDLTNGAPRLRLKPYLKFSAGFQKNFQKDNPFGNDEGNLLVTLEGYYNIPILDKYQLTAEFNASYSDKFDVSEDILFNYSLTFGYKTPVDNLQVLLKVVNGKNEVNLGEATVYSLGVLLDFFPID